MRYPFCRTAEVSLTSPHSPQDLLTSLMIRLGVTYLILIGIVGCGDPRKELNPISPQVTPPTSTESKALTAEKLNKPQEMPKPKVVPPPAPVIPPLERVVIVQGGVERVLRDVDARRQGFEIIDMRDTWTPYIFMTHKGTEEQQLEHSYREIFVKLANDQGDNDGQPINKGEFNYLEVFGIPPSMGVLWERVNREVNESCYRDINYDKIAAAKSIRFGNRSYQRRYDKKVRKAERAVERAMNKHIVDSYEDLLEVAPRYKSQVEALLKYQRQAEAIQNIEKRLTCDLHNHPRYRHKAGKLDQGLRLGIRRFQRKHKLYEYANLKSDTISALATPAYISNFNSFKRALSERIIEATGILEDGTVNRFKNPVTYLGKDGQRHEIRNLVQEFTDAALQQLELDTPEKVRAFFQRHKKEDFKWMRFAVRFPPLPEYYSEHMELSVVVDRGDIWYDPPFNDNGKRIKQRRKRLPKFKLYTKYNDQLIQLIHWPTTIGGWRTEIAANGHVYYKYKNSDVGNRVIRNIISGPVWVPPKSTPLKSLAKRRYINGRGQNIVNYEEMGPGYLSAYGLVAGYFVIPGRNGRRDHDKGIRAHGSSDFMSILSPERFSHGCHRLKNDHAVRLYGFILNHRNHIVLGDQKIRHERNFLHREEVFQIRVLTRGYRYELQPPVPVEVLEGRIKGKLKKPIEDYVEDPAHEYPDGNPDDPPVPEEQVAQEGAAGQPGVEGTTPGDAQAPEAGAQPQSAGKSSASPVNAPLNNP